MDKDKIYVRQICFLFGAFILPVKLITAPAIAAKYAAEDLWISALINFMIDGLAILLICRLANKFKGATVFEIVENTLGKTGKIIFAAAFYLFFTVKAYLPLIEHRNFVEIAMYETTPALWIFLPVFLLSAFFSYKGFRAAGRAADIAIWFSASGIIILAALSLSVADFSNLLPIIDVPAINILNGSVKTSIWFFDSPYLLFLLGHFKPEKKQTLKITGGYFAFALVAIVYMLILQCEFGTLTERQFFTPVKMGKYSVSVSNIGRIDYIAVFSIIMSCIFGVTLPILFASVCLEKTFPFRHKITPCLISNGVIALIIFFTENYYFVIRDYFQRSLVPVMGAFLLAPLALWFFKPVDKTGGGRDGGFIAERKKESKSCAF